MSALAAQFFFDWRSLVPILLVGFLPNEVWRLLGWWLGSGLGEDSELFVWIRLTTTGILAGVIAQLLIAPPGVLAQVSGPLRYGAVIAGLVAFLGIRRSLLIGIGVAEAVLMAGLYLNL